MSPVEIKAALEALHDKSLCWALRCCGWNKEEAREVLQSSYLKVLDGSARFEGRSQLKTWFFSVIRRTASEHRRRSFFFDFSIKKFGLENQESDRELPFAGVEHTQVRREIQRAMDQLSPRQREVIDLVFFHEMTLEEASEAMGSSIGTARTHYDRAKKELAKSLSGKGLL